MQFVRTVDGIVSHPSFLLKKGFNYIIRDVVFEIPYRSKFTIYLIIIEGIPVLSHLHTMARLSFELPS